MSAGRTLSLLSGAVLCCATLIGMSSTASIAGEKKHDIQGLELGMSRDDVLKKLKSMNCADTTDSKSWNPDFHKSFHCPDIDFDVQFVEHLAGFPLVEIKASYRGILTLEEQIKSIEQQFDVVLSSDGEPSTWNFFRSSLGQGRTIVFGMSALNRQTIQYCLLTITDDKLNEDDTQAGKEATRQKFSAPPKF
jgi:hypothetical protein